MNNLRHLIPYRLLIPLIVSFPLGILEAGEVAVVVNAENSLSSLTPSQVSDLFLGRSTTFPDGSYVTVIDQSRASPIRQHFFKGLNGMSLNQVNSYWARLTFSGRVLPPETAEGSQQVLRRIRENRMAIGYLDAADADASVRIVLRLNL
ncbi:MAG: hypothetical protein HQL56_01355 [Magnetococcales bacterium]|nr:hypothetical protein [Magnetococcales bacterium]